MIKVYRPVTIYFRCQIRGEQPTLLETGSRIKTTKRFTEPTPFTFQLIFFKEILGSTCISNSLEVHPYH